MYTIEDYLLGEVPLGAAVTCPFHEDDHASAQIMADTGRFWCFACRWGGDRYEVARRLWFADLPPGTGLAMASAYLERIGRGTPSLPAVRHERFGTSVGRGDRPPWGLDRQDPCLRLVHLFCTEATNALRAHPLLIRRIQKERGLTDPIALGIGIAFPEVFERIQAAANEQIPSWSERSQQLLCQAGVTTRDGWFRLNNRLILPATDPDGTVIAYQARALAPHHPVRYLNIPGWAKVPAGLATLDRPGPLYLVEGWFDAAPLWESGLAALALGGLTLPRPVRRHIRPREVVIILDADESATTRPHVEQARHQLVATLTKLGCQVQCMLPPYKDVSLWAATEGQAAVVISLLWDQQGGHHDRDPLVRSTDTDKPTDRITDTPL